MAPPIQRARILREAATRTALVLCATVAGLGLTEVLLRTLRVAPAGRHASVVKPRPLYREMPGFRHHKSYVPGDYRETFFSCDGIICRPDKVVPMHVNSQGLRDIERPIAKPPGTVRILVLGDSFSAAMGVETPQTYAKQLESLLNRLSRGRPRYDVINAAVDGHASLSQANYLERWGLRYRPDLIIIGFYLNDPFPIWLPELATDRQNGVSFKSFMRHHKSLRPDYHSNAPRLTLSYAQPLYILRWLAAFRDGMILQEASREWYALLWGDENPIGLHQMEDAFRTFARIRRERDIPVLVLVFPKLDWLDESYPLAYIHERAARLFRRNGIPFVDLMLFLKGRRPKSLWQHPSDHHPNAWVHKLAASVLFQHLSAEPRFRRALRLDVGGAMGGGMTKQPGLTPSPGMRPAGTQ